MTDEDVRLGALSAADRLSALLNAVRWHGVRAPVTWASLGVALASAMDNGILVFGEAPEKVSIGSATHAGYYVAVGPITDARDNVYHHDRLERAVEMAVAAHPWVAHVLQWTPRDVVDTAAESPRE